jgi:2-(1,2-epoxy-1,2-dihydrophenyl)acetyl-CoA isomerase
MGPEVEVTREGDVLQVALNRPQALNAINVGLLHSLVAALRAIGDARAVVLTGNGRAFCVGEDLKQTLAPETGEAAELRAAFLALQEITRLLTGSDAVVIAAVHGYAIGGGAELALAADMVIGGPQARFRFPEVSLGHAVTGGISARLPQLVGLLKAKELLLTSRWVEAGEALALGLLNEIADDPQQRARELAAQLSAFPARSLAATKRSLEVAGVPNQEAALAAEVDAASWCFSAAEAGASIEAFRAR